MTGCVLHHHPLVVVERAAACAGSTRGSRSCRCRASARRSRSRPDRRPCSRAASQARPRCRRRARCDRRCSCPSPPSTASSAAIVSRCVLRTSLDERGALERRRELRHDRLAQPFPALVPRSRPRSRDAAADHACRAEQRRRSGVGLTERISRPLPPTSSCEGVLARSRSARLRSWALAARPPRTRRGRGGRRYAPRARRSRGAAPRLPRAPPRRAARALDVLADGEHHHRRREREASRPMIPTCS